MFIAIYVLTLIGIFARLFVKLIPNSGTEISLNLRSFFHLGWGISLVSIAFYISYLLMLMGALLVPIGLLFNLVSMFIAIKHNSKRDIYLAACGLILSIAGIIIDISVFSTFYGN